MSFTLIIYIFLSFIIFLISSKLSYILNLTDVPNKRKIHSKPVAFTGGITISIVLLCSIIIFDSYNKTLSLILSIGFLISTVGLIDDRYNLSSGNKLSLQVITILYLLFFENLVLNQIGNYEYFSIDLGAFALPFTLLSLLFLINSFNYFDGIDGLLGFSTISVLAILYFLSFLNNSHFLVIEQNVQFVFIAITIPIVTFLFFNFSILGLPKLFLGDSGSLLLGFIISFLLIYFANLKFIHPILLAWSVVIFVYEFLSINIIRIKNKKKVFEAGQDHLHHVLLNNTKSVLFTNVIITSTNLFLFIIGYLSYTFINELSSLILFVVFFIIFLFFRISYLSK